MHVFILVQVSITSLLHVSMCYIYHLQGETLITCKKLSAFSSVLYETHTRNLWARCRICLMFKQVDYIQLNSVMTPSVCAKPLL